MTISETQICNLAFNKLGHEGTIATIGESSTEGELTQRYYEYVRDFLLADHTWNFAIARSVLSRDASNPAFEFSYQYLLPADFIRPLAMYNSNETFKMEIKDDGSVRLLTNEGTVNLVYVRKQADVTTYIPTFVDAFVTKLAAEMCEVITSDSNRAARLFGEAEIKLKKAKRVDGQSGTPSRIVSKGFTNFKTSNTNGLNPRYSY